MNENTKQKLFLAIIIIILLIVLYVVLFVLPLKSSADVSMQRYCMPIPTPSVISPTPNLTPTPVAGSSASGGTGVIPNNPSTNTTSTPGAATCQISFKSGLLQGFHRVTPTQVALTWWDSTDNIDYYSLIYGYSPNSLIYGIPHIPSNSTGITINDLIPDHWLWAQLIANKNGCAAYSSIIDP